MDKYSDIIRTDHPVSARHPAMPVEDRAAQFSPFSALTGYDAVIAETARLTDSGIELDEDAKAMVNAALVRLQARLADRTVAAITYFSPDQRKAGGAYTTVTGRIRKIDLYEAYILLTDGTRIPMEHIYQIDDGNRQEPV